MRTCRLDSLQTQRLAAGYTVQRLARESLTSDNIITNLEQTPVGGDIEEAVAIRIAAVLGVTVGDLGQSFL